MPPGDLSAEAGRRSKHGLLSSRPAGMRAAKEPGRERPSGTLAPGPGRRQEAWPAWGLRVASYNEGLVPAAPPLPCLATPRLPLFLFGSFFLSFLSGGGAGVVVEVEVEVRGGGGGKGTAFVPG